MKRFIILGGIVLLGAVSALMYTLFPPVETQLNADMAEDGEVSVTETERNAVQSGSVRFSLPSGFYSRTSRWSFQRTAARCISPPTAPTRFPGSPSFTRSPSR
ncbi:MAG: hypothetical protein ACLSG5_11915 [Oscillospiraceae bacterium]